jgi:hypothetical protein
MSYELHIERLSASDPNTVEEIALARWKDAVAGTEGVRHRPPGLFSVTNPTTGEVLSIPTEDGDAEVYFPREDKWHLVFRWRRGSASFKARPYVGDLSHPAWAAAVSLAETVDAVIRGDEGEVYDFETGEITEL